MITDLIVVTHDGTVLSHGEATKRGYIPEHSVSRKIYGYCGVLEFYIFSGNGEKNISADRFLLGFGYEHLKNHPEVKPVQVHGELIIAYRSKNPQAPQLPDVFGELCCIADPTTGLDAIQDAASRIMERIGLNEIEYI